jgi:hypothetical protein
MTKSLPNWGPSLRPTTVAASEDPQDQTPGQTNALPAHYQAGQDACTALSRFISFMNPRPHNDDYPEHRKVCQEALEAATSATANRSEVKTNLSCFDEAWSDLPECIQRKNHAPDLTDEEYNEYEDLWYQMDYHRAKFEAMALNPDGCTERSKVDDSLLHGDALKGELLDTADLDLNSLVQGQLRIGSK